MWGLIVLKMADRQPFWFLHTYNTQSNHSTTDSKFSVIVCLGGGTRCTEGLLVQVGAGPLIKQMHVCFQSCTCTKHTSELLMRREVFDALARQVIVCLSMMHVCNECVC